MGISLSTYLSLSPTSRTTHPLHLSPSTPCNPQPNQCLHLFYPAPSEFLLCKAFRGFAGAETHGEFRFGGEGEGCFEAMGKLGGGLGVEAWGFVRVAQLMELEYDGGDGKEMRREEEMGR